MTLMNIAKLQNWHWRNYWWWLKPSTSLQGKATRDVHGTEIAHHWLVSFTSSTPTIPSGLITAQWAPCPNQFSWLMRKQKQELLLAKAAAWTTAHNSLWKHLTLDCLQQAIDGHSHFKQATLEQINHDNSDCVGWKDRLSRIRSH